MLGYWDLSFGYCLWFVLCDLRFQGSFAARNLPQLNRLALCLTYPWAQMKVVASQYSIVYVCSLLFKLLASYAACFLSCLFLCSLLFKLLVSMQLAF